MKAVFKQPVYPGDKGSDVLAFHRALRKRGYKKVLLSRTAGPQFVDAVKEVQKNHKLTADGIIGPTTFAIIKDSIDSYGALLIKTAKVRTHGYVNPFKNATVWVGRIDQGVDYHGRGPIAAVGNAVIIGNGGSGWPGGNYLLYQLLDGPHSGRHIYVAEAIDVVVRSGQKVKAGETIAHFNSGSAPGMYPGIETGWGSSTLNLTLAAEIGNTGGPGHSDSPSGLCFARFLYRIKTPVIYNPGNGPEYPI